MQAELIEKTRSLGDALAKIRQLYDAIETDLDEARRLQTSFLDDTHRRFASARVSLWLKASGHVGGDMVGFFEVSPQVFGFYSMDVSGHGVAAGMLAARVAGMLRDNAPDLNIALSFIGGGHFAPVPPDMVAAQLNAQILNEAKGERYLTLCLGFLDQRSGVIRMVQAGHPTPLLLRADGGIERLGNGGMPLGLIPEARYRQFEFLMRAGDKLLLYSDGLTECPVADGTYLEEDGLVELCRLHGQASGEDMIARMAADLEEMSGRRGFPRRRLGTPGGVRRPERLAPQLQPAGHEMPVTGHGQQIAGLGPWQEDGAVPVFRRLRPSRPEAGGVDVALLLRMQVIFRHVGEPVEHAEPAQPMDRVAGFLHHLAGKRDLRAFARIDTAARQLQFGARLFLKGGEKTIARVDDRIDPGSRRVALPGQGLTAKSTVHAVP